MQELNFNELRKLLKTPTENNPLVRVALLGDTATQFLATALRGTGILYGYKFSLFEADFNQVERMILDKSSELYEFQPQYTIIFQSTHKLLGKFNKLKSEVRSELAHERIEFLRLAAESLPGKLIILNYPEIDDQVFGSFGNKLGSSFIFQLRKLNFELMQFAAGIPNVFIADVASLQNKYGRDRLFTASVYINSDMVLSLELLPAVADTIISVIVAVEGRFRKCLILDLDNTLWGGVIGDDGIENIQLGSLGIGKAFTEFQQWCKKLKDRGIILAVCSKNTESVAREVFEKHPDMALRSDDIAVFMANWDNKADNIRRIQEILNIGFDSMVFIDDNPFERNMVRQNVPGVVIPEMPEDPAEWLEYLYSLNLFETASWSANDEVRTKQYQVEAMRVNLQKSYTNEDDFLRSLEMISEVSKFNEFNTPRIAQLSQRSNQFNLRTVRFTEDDITRIAADPGYHTFSFTLSDKFGENGLICVIILEELDADSIFINTWLMSCRVLKRGMEHFTLDTIAKYAITKGFKKLIGEYLPTAKNIIVKDHYLNLGFKEAGSQWILDLNEYSAKGSHIKIK